MTIEALCLVFSCSVIADTALTYDWINFHNGREANPFWAKIINRPKLVLTLDFGIMAGVSFAATGVGKKNKTIAIIGMAALCAVQGYYLWCHYNIRRNR